MLRVLFLFPSTRGVYSTHSRRKHRVRIEYTRMGHYHEENRPTVSLHLIVTFLDAFCAPSFFSLKSHKKQAIAKYLNCNVSNSLIDYDSQIKTL